MSEELKFYDLKKKKSFTTSSYKIVKKGNRRFAVAKAPSGIDSWRIIGRVKCWTLKRKQR